MDLGRSLLRTLGFALGADAALISLYYSNALNNPALNEFLMKNNLPQYTGQIFIVAGTALAAGYIGKRIMQSCESAILGEEEPNPLLRQRH